MAFRGIKDVEIFGGFDYLLIRGAGMITSAQYFPRATAGGINASLGLSYAITPAIGVAATANLRRYFFNMHSAPGDPMVAGGAVDQYPSATLSAVVRL